MCMSTLPPNELTVHFSKVEQFKAKSGNELSNGHTESSLPPSNTVINVHAWRTRPNTTWSVLVENTSLTKSAFFGYEYALNKWLCIKESEYLFQHVVLCFSKVPTVL